MVKKKTSQSKAIVSPQVERSAVTPERFTRLVRLLRLLATSSSSREDLTQQLRVDVRGFYRDLELLRGSGIGVSLEEGRYRLTDPVENALDRLPFPDPHLSLGEIRQLARGRSKLHQKLHKRIDLLMP